MLCVTHTHTFQCQCPFISAVRRQLREQMPARVGVSSWSLWFPQQHLEKQEKERKTETFYNHDILFHLEFNFKICQCLHVQPELNFSSVTLLYLLIYSFRGAFSVSLVLLLLTDYFYAALHFLQQCHGCEGMPEPDDVFIFLYPVLTKETQITFNKTFCVHYKATQTEKVQCLLPPF